MEVILHSHMLESQLNIFLTFFCVYVLLRFSVFGFFVCSTNREGEHERMKTYVYLEKWDLASVSERGTLCRKRKKKNPSDIRLKWDRRTNEREEREAYRIKLFVFISARTHTRSQKISSHVTEQRGDHPPQSLRLRREIPFPVSLEADKQIWQCKPETHQFLESVHSRHLPTLSSHGNILRSKREQPDASTWSYFFFLPLALISNWIKPSHTFHVSI